MRQPHADLAGREQVREPLPLVGGRRVSPVPGRDDGRHLLGASRDGAQPAQAPGGVHRPDAQGDAPAVRRDDRQPEQAGGGATGIGSSRISRTPNRSAAQAARLAVPSWTYLPEPSSQSR
ncbi:hypothetical protein GCM10009850_029890 [Nonomuraea monospora]|uniref:Uncharacterized protein n=1 Tax=Nonomuraea monospora TaxID=568818 RepID=A0ABP5P973_9ACTN